MDQTENGLDRAKNRLNGRANNRVLDQNYLFFGPKSGAIRGTLPPSADNILGRNLWL